jgi:hypothetical protein
MLPARLARKDEPFPLRPAADLLIVKGSAAIFLKLFPLAKAGNRSLMNAF